MCFFRVSLADTEKTHAQKPLSRTNVTLLTNYASGIIEMMQPKRVSKFLAWMILSLAIFISFSGFQAPVQADAGSASDIIGAVNAIRTGYGNTALIVDPILMSTAQSTANIMASTGNCAHIGNVSGRVAAAGYGGGGQVYATENIACGNNLSVDTTVNQYWADADHMLPMTNAAYTHVGAGVTVVDGRVFYVLHAAYTTNSSYTGGGSPAGGATSSVPVATVPVILPVKTSTFSPDGSLVQVVEEGQTLWTIAAAYGVTIEELMAVNHYTSTPLLIVGDTVIIKAANTLTPTATVTDTPLPPTRTPTRTPTPKTPTPTRTATATLTSTPRMWIKIEPPAWLDNHSLGMGLLAVSGLGLLFVGIGTFRKKD